MKKHQSVILAIIGQVGSGKGTIASYIEQCYSGKIFKFSTPLRSILSILSLDQSRENMQILSLRLREGFGQDILSYAAKKEILGTTSKIAILD